MIIVKDGEIGFSYLVSSSRFQHAVDLDQDPVRRIELAQDNVGTDLLGQLEEIDVVERAGAGNGDDTGAPIHLAQCPDDLRTFNPRHAHVGDDQGGLVPTVHV